MVVIAWRLVRGAPHQPVPALVVPGVPAQAEVDRLLSSYEAWVYVDEGAGDGTSTSELERAGREVRA